jgi:hypothetical protein
MRLEKNPSDKLIKLPDSASALSNGLIAADFANVALLTNRR